MSDKEKWCDRCGFSHPDDMEHVTSAELPHFYAYSNETPSRKLRDEDDMRDYAAAVLKDANDLCRSAMEIAKRDGKDTNWQTFRDQLEASLKRQHATMYPPRPKWIMDALLIQVHQLEMTVTYGGRSEICGAIDAVESALVELRKFVTPAS